MKSIDIEHECRGIYIMGQWKVPALGKYPRFVLIETPLHQPYQTPKNNELAGEVMPNSLWRRKIRP